MLWYFLEVRVVLPGVSGSGARLVGPLVMTATCTRVSIACAGEGIVLFRVSRRAI